MHREKEQSSKHQTQNSDHEGKILLHSSIYKHETDYNGSISQIKRNVHQWSHPQKSRSTLVEQGGKLQHKTENSQTFRPLQNGCLLVYIGRRTDPSLPH